jgi:hypothetical protein
MEVGSQGHVLAALPPGNRPASHCTGGWVGPTIGLDGCGKSPLPELNAWAVQPVASRYAEYAIPAHRCVDFSEIFVKKIIKILA